MSRHKNIRPPAVAEKLLIWYCRNAQMEDLFGDLEELFVKESSVSLRNARLAYWRRVFSLIVSYAVKSRKQKASIHHYSANTFNPAMLKNYFLIATRNLAKNKLFTLINVFGLAVGMSISLLLIAMISFIATYDNFHVNKEKIFRIISFTDDKQNNDQLASCPVPLALKLTEEFSGVRKVVRINSTLSAEAEYQTRKIPLSGYYADPGFLEIFTFPLLQGDIHTALERPNTMVITEKAARKMFGSATAIGKVIDMGPHGAFEITGLLKDHPKNSHMHFEVVGSYETLTTAGRETPTRASDPWYDFFNSYVYLQLEDERDVPRVEQYLARIAKQTYPKDQNLTVEFKLQALTAIAPGMELHNQIGPEWGYASLSIFVFLTLLILMPACFNYANISISRALKRMKEIGLRKVMGGQRSQIFFQFIMETVIITLVALLISYYIFYLIQPEFLALMVNSDALELTPDVNTLVYFVLFALFVGLVAGIVPAVYFARLTPIDALKAKSLGKGKFTLRKILIVSQFALSLAFIMSVVIVLNQYRHTMNYDFGFRKDNILDVELQGVDPAIVKNEFLKLAPVESISMSSHIVGTEHAGADWVRDAGSTDSAEVFQIFVDENYLANVKLTLLAGSNFSGDSSSFSQVIVNEEFLKRFRLAGPSEALDQTFVLSDGSEVTVKGVVKDFHYLDLRAPIQSFFFRYDPAQWKYANVAIISGDVFSDVSALESSWKKIGNGTRFEAKFFSDEVADAYSFYFTMIKICGFLGALAITISCLGLLGMVVFTVENRTKEVGIRKVMGATSAGVTLLLSKDFMKLMGIAIMIAVPLTYVFFEKVYLNMQYYRAQVGILDVVISVLILLLLGLSTILSQTLRAARTNPVDTLRYE
jgi:putative ABC transport system permease protein